MPLPCCLVKHIMYIFISVHLHQESGRILHKWSEMKSKVHNLFHNNKTKSIIVHQFLEQSISWNILILDIEQVARIADADFIMQHKYMAQKPKKIEIYLDKAFLEELENIQKDRYRHPALLDANGKDHEQGKRASVVGAQQQQSSNEDPSKDR